MADAEAAYRKQQDAQIEATGACYIYRLHMTASHTKLLLDTGSHRVEEDGRQQLKAILTADEWHRGKDEKGLRCTAVGPRNWLFDVTIKLVGDDCSFDTDWNSMMHRCKINMNAVLSIWGYNQDGRTQFIFRLDQHADENSLLPPPPTFSGGQRRAATTNGGRDDCGSCCGCSII